METYDYVAEVAPDGSLHLEGLPPYTQVRVTVLPLDPASRRAELELLFADIRRNHPFAKMTKEEILAVLRKTREEVAEELYGHLF